VVSSKPARIAFCVGLLACAQFAGSQIGSFATAHAQDADAAVAEYMAVLEQIQNVKIRTMQREVMLGQQKSNMEDLRTQIESVPATKGEVRRIVTEMVAEIEKVIESDLPFREDERSARMEKMRSLLADDATSDVELYRRAMTLYDVEANYGYTISAYAGDHPSNPGNYVHFGRLSFIYLDFDSREGFRWSKESDGWEPLAAGDILNARRSVRVARGESAPSVVTAPVKIQAAQ